MFRHPATMKARRILTLATALILLISPTACDKWPWEESVAQRGEGAADEPAADEVDDPGDSSSDSIGRVLKGEMKDVYRYTDATGVVNYVDSLDKVPARYRKVAKHPSGGVVNIFPSTSIDEVMAREKIDPGKYKGKAGASSGSGGQVILYSTTWCGYCTKARNYLKRKKVAFIEKDVGNNRDNLQEMLRKSGGARGVPVLDVGGTIIRGFSARAVDQALSR